MTIPSLSATGGAADASSFERDGASVNAAATIALPLITSGAHSDLRSNTLC